MMSPSELAAYLQVMRENGCIVFKSGDTELHCEPGQRPKSPAELIAKALEDGESDHDDKWLYAATEGYPAPDGEGTEQ